MKKVVLNGHLMDIGWISCWTRGVLEPNAMAKTVRRLSRRLSHWLFGSKELELELESDSMTLEGLVQSL